MMVMVMVIVKVIVMMMMVVVLMIMIITSIFYLVPVLCSPSIQAIISFTFKRPHVPQIQLKFF